MMTGHKGESEHKQANGMKPGEKKGEEKEEGKHGHEGEEKDGHKALTKSGSNTEMQKGGSRPNSNRKYHHTHMNALHHMGKAACKFD